MPFGEVMKNCQRWTYRCHPEVIVDENYTKSKLEFNWKIIRINLEAIYLNQRKCLPRRNQDKPLIDLN